MTSSLKVQTFTPGRNFFYRRISGKNSRRKINFKILYFCSLSFLWRLGLCYDESGLFPAFLRHYRSKRSQVKFKKTSKRVNPIDSNLFDGWILRDPSIIPFLCCRSVNQSVLLIFKPWTLKVIIPEQLATTRKTLSPYNNLMQNLRRL